MSQTLEIQNFNHDLDEPVRTDLFWAEHLLGSEIEFIVQTDEFRQPHAIDSIALAETASDRFNVEKASQFIADVMSSQDENINLETSQFSQENILSRSLFEAVKKAKQGDTLSRNLIKENVTTDICERLFKHGFIVKTNLNYDNNGQIWQYGQNLEDIQANAIKYSDNNPQFSKRIFAEVNNSFRLSDEIKNGHLKDYNFVVISLVPDDMTTADIKKMNFYTDTMSMSIQSVSMKENQLLMESAFVAGKKDVNSENKDKQMIGHLGDFLGQNLRHKTSTELLNFPLLVHKDKMKNGVADLVQVLDEYDPNDNIFFGRSTKEVKDYESVPDRYEAFQASMELQVESVVDSLISNADSINDEVSACKMLSKLCSEQVVLRAVADDQIDASVLGKKAESFVKSARVYKASGNSEALNHNVRLAVMHDKSGSCPVTLSSMSGHLTPASLSLAGFNKNDWHGGEIHENAVCRTCKLIKPQVGGCYICKDCVQTKQYLTA